LLCSTLAVSVLVQSGVDAACFICVHVTCVVLCRFHCKTHVTSFSLISQASTPTFVSFILKINEIYLVSSNVPSNFCGVSRANERLHNIF